MLRYLYEAILWFITDDIFEHYEEAWNIKSDYGYLWPNNDSDVLKAMAEGLSEICEEIFDVAELEEALKEVINIAENYEINKNIAPDEWRLSRLQRNMILDTFLGNTNNVSNSRKGLFKRIVDEECENGNQVAMQIKGYGCYGGDNVFECDWEESRKWITKLFEKSGNPQYANTLGYIYYYGRCNNGVPDYEKAFQYFSVGAAHDLIESMYKIADMFLGGKGCIKSPQTSDYIVDKLYWDCKNTFSHSGDGKFADVALRKAAAFERRELFPDALGYYLEADYAIKKRLRKSDFFGDKKVQDNITKSIANVKAKLPSDYFVEELNMSWPFWLYDMLDKDCKAKVEIETVGENRYRIRIDRHKKDHPGKALIVAPQLECVTLARVFESEFITDKPIEYKCKDKKNTKVNCIKYLEEGEYTFCNGDEEVFTIKDAEFILKKSDFKG